MNKRLLRRKIAILHCQALCAVHSFTRLPKPASGNPAARLPSAFPGSFPLPVSRHPNADPEARFLESTCNCSKAGIENSLDFPSTGNVIVTTR